MAYWLGEFRQAFFDEWDRAGLAPPRPEPADFRPAAAAPAEITASDRLGVDAIDVPPALADDVVESVYGFGHEFGRVCTLGAGLCPDEVEDLCDWCGRFNLGISLFDYVCDELDDQTSLLLSAPAFAPFSGRTAVRPEELDDPVVAALDEVAREVLEDLSRLIGPRTGSSRRYGLWRAVDSMFGAQVELTSDSTFRANGGELLTAMRSKSSEPFRVMAEFVAKGASLPPGQQRRLGAFGRAAGDCFWLVDDAADVWSDLDRGRANYFLTAATTVDPDLDLSSPSPIVEARLGRIWRIARLAENSSKRVCGDFATTLSRVDGSAPTVSEHIATMVARWAS